MVWQCFQHISTTLFRNKKHDTRHRKDIQHDRSDDISHITYYFWKSSAEATSIRMAVLTVIAFMGRPLKNESFVNSFSCRFPMLKIISYMTNIITTIILNVLSIPGGICFLVRNKVVLLC